MNSNRRSLIHRILAAAGCLFVARGVKASESDTAASGSREPGKPGELFTVTTYDCEGAMIGCAGPSYANTTPLSRTEFFYDEKGRITKRIDYHRR